MVDNEGFGVGHPALLFRFALARRLAVAWRAGPFVANAETVVSAGQVDYRPSWPVALCAGGRRVSSWPTFAGAAGVGCPLVEILEGVAVGFQVAQDGQQVVIVLAGMA